MQASLERAFDAIPDQITTGAVDALDLGAVDERDDRGHAADSILIREHGMLFHVDVEELSPMVLGLLLDERLDRLARRAPLRSELSDDVALGGDVHLPATRVSTDLARAW